MANESTFAQDIRKKFEQAGFVVADAGLGRLELKKSGCVSTLASKGGRWIRSGAPCLLVHGVPCELEDVGYQKFWLSKTDGQRFPIRKVDLETLHRFDEEIRYIIGQRNLYNESLGSTNARTVYDRLAGRADR